MARLLQDPTAKGVHRVNYTTRNGQNGQCSLKPESELDILKVSALSTEEVATQAASLYDRWQTMPTDEKREMVELITEKIVIAKDEITISLYYSPSCKDMANRWRKGWDSNPR